MHCPKCNSERKGNLCWKCGETTFLPKIDWEYPRMPDINLIRSFAKEVGYAVAVHGSLERDLDLIAVPWTKEAVPFMKLIDHLEQRLNAKSLVIESKPHGRVACSLQIDGYFKIIDLSITPVST